MLHISFPLERRKFEIQEIFREYFKRPLLVRSIVYGDKHSSVGKSYQNLGRVYEERAVEYYSKANEIMKGKSGDPILDLHKKITKFA